MFTNFFGPVNRKLSAFTRVQNGISFLNNNFKGNSWIEEINLETFCLHYTEDCILGQLFHSFGRGQNILSLNNTDCEKLGFLGYGVGIDTPYYFEDSKELTEEWVKQIGELANV